MKKYLRGEDGQGIMEYGLIIALISIVLIGSIMIFSSNLENQYTQLEGNINIEEQEN